MDNSVIKTGKTVEEAVNAALEELGVSSDMADIEVLNEASDGFLGVGKKEAEVKVTVKASADDAEDDDDTYYGDDENYEGDAVTEAEDAAVNFVAEVLSGIGIHGNLDSYREDDDIYISVTGSECGSVIGRHGETLDAISYMTNLIANKHSEQRVHVHLDVGGYRKHRERIVINLADKAVSKCLRTGRDVVMEPMSPADRRIVHFHLAEVQGITTHSEGVEPRRCVVVSLDNK